MRTKVEQSAGAVKRLWWRKRMPSLPLADRWGYLVEESELCWAMVLPPTYSRRKRQSEGNSPNIYHYDHIPPHLRIQIIHIFSDAIGDYSESNYGADHDKCYDYLVKSLCKDIGVLKLTDDPYLNSKEAFFEWIQSESNIDRLLDGYEQGLQLIDGYIRGHSAFQYSVEMSPDDAIAEANARFQKLQ
jgi:hypothetical protein